MKKKFILLSLSAVSFLGFKNALPPTGATAANNHLTPLKNYVTPVNKYPKQLQQNRLYAGGYAPGIVARSNSGQFILNYQTDGNLVLYSMFPSIVALWASGPTMTFGGTNMVVSDHGWIAIYKGSTLLWGDASGSMCSVNSANNWYVLQDDGNFVKYNHDCTQSVSTRTHGGQYSLNWGTLQ